jgi:hypothetical protein
VERLSARSYAQKTGAPLNQHVQLCQNPPRTSVRHPITQINWACEKPSSDCEGKHDYESSSWSLEITRGRKSCERRWIFWSICARLAVCVELWIFHAFLNPKMRPNRRILETLLLVEYLDYQSTSSIWKSKVVQNEFFEIFQVLHSGVVSTAGLTAARSCVSFISVSNQSLIKYEVTLLYPSLISLKPLLIRRKRCQTPIISVPQPTEVAGTIDEQPSEEYVRVRGLITPKNSIWQVFADRCGLKRWWSCNRRLLWYVYQTRSMGTATLAARADSLHRTSPTSTRSSVYDFITKENGRYREGGEFSLENQEICNWYRTEYILPNKRYVYIGFDVLLILNSRTHRRCTHRLSHSWRA